ncbi:MAG: HAD-IA family hydrolase [Coriobacteriia bacterium]|jgi:REG-2-like HAD superfamily hydrolase|nr:HAD-IA family hydrolase [Coriobacteriia bacterium]
MTHAVFFDVGNTLLHPYPSVSEVCRQVLEEAGHTRDLSAIDSVMPLVDAHYEDRYSEDDTFWTDENATNSVWIGMYSLMARELGIERDAELLAHRVYEEFGRAERWRPYDDVIPAFKRLKGRGQRIGIISNWDGRLSALLAEMGIAEMVDTIVSSAEVGLHKPDPRIFELACERLDVMPSDAVHVGDHRYADIFGASAVGMEPVLIDRQGATVLTEGITTLDALEEYLGWVTG